MKFETTYLHCSNQLRDALRAEIGEIESAVAAVQWADSFEYADKVTTFSNQAGYNKAFAAQFIQLGWKPQPTLRLEPKLIGDFRKGLVFVEVQFGNSSALYRDYYKFQYGLANGLLSLAVLIVPTSPIAFFPTRPRSVNNMAEYELALSYLSVMPVNVPTLVLGLLPLN